VAKKKEVKTSTVQNFFSQFKSDINDPGGVKLQSYAQQYLFDMDHIRFGHMYMLVGEPGSGKSQVAADIISMCVRSGGGGMLIDTEHKASAASTLIPLVGEEVYNSGRFVFRRADAVENAESVAVEGGKAWMPTVTHFLEVLRKDPAAREQPMAIVVDSIFGSASEASRKKFAETGAGQGQSTSGMQRANTVTDFCTNIASLLSGTKAVLILVNHGKDKIDMQSYGPPKKKRQIPGGNSLRHHMSLILWFKKGGPVRLKTTAGRDVYIDNECKNSFGCDDRSVKVAFYVDMFKDSNGEFIKDEQGNYVRRIAWDWHGASAEKLWSFVGNTNANKNIAAVRDNFPGLKRVNKKYSSKTLGFEGLTETEFGRRLVEDTDLYDRLQQHVHTAVNRGTPELLVTPVADPRDSLDSILYDEAGNSLKEEGFDGEEDDS